MKYYMKCKFESKSVKRKKYVKVNKFCLKVCHIFVSQLYTKYHDTITKRNQDIKNKCKKKLSPINAKNTEK